MIDKLIVTWSIGLIPVILFVCTVAIKWEPYKNWNLAELIFGVYLGLIVPLLLFKVWS